MLEELLTPEDAARITGLTRSELAHHTHHRTYGLHSVHRAGKTWYRADNVRHFRASLEATRAAELLFR
jgi:ribosomal protein S12 methylthiotransferase accessory factor YcaO